MNLPLTQSSDSVVNQILTKWKSIIDPTLSNPSLNTSILTNQKLVTGQNLVNHLLGRNLQGWRIVRRRQFLVTGAPTAYDIYDNQDQNQHPNLTLALTCDQGTSSNPVVVDIEVF